MSRLGECVKGIGACGTLPPIGNTRIPRWPIHHKICSGIRSQIPSLSRRSRASFVPDGKYICRFGKRHLCRDLFPFPRIPHDLCCVARENVVGRCGRADAVRIAVGRAGGDDGERCGCDVETGHIPAKGDPVILCDFVVTGAGRARWLGDGDAASSGGARDADGRGAARAVGAGRPVGSGSR